MQGLGSAKGIVPWKSTVSISKIKNSTIKGGDWESSLNRNKERIK